MAKPTLEMLNEWSRLGHRTAFGESMVLLGAENPNVYITVADTTTTARLVNFQNAYPERLYDVGICEQNLIDTAAGFAKEGLLPYVATLACFAPMRCAEQMRIVLGYMNLNVKVVGIEAGVSFGPLSNTHFAMDDIAVARSIPNFTVIAPADAREIYKAVFAAAEYPGPVYIRLTGAAPLRLIYTEDYDFQIGKAVELRDGTDVALISSGSMLTSALDAADILKAKGVSARVINMHTVKPLDTETLDKVFAENKLIITIEEHSVIGGLGSAVAEYKAQFANAPKQLICGLKDSFRKVGSYPFQLADNGLTGEAVAALAEKNL